MRILPSTLHARRTRTLAHGQMLIQKRGKPHFLKLKRFYPI
jgi:hypothetical protein